MFFFQWGWFIDFIRILASWHLKNVSRVKKTKNLFYLLCIEYGFKSSTEMIYIIALDLHRAIGLVFFWISTNENRNWDNSVYIWKHNIWQIQYVILFESWGVGSALLLLHFYFIAHAPHCFIPFAHAEF